MKPEMLIKRLEFLASTTGLSMDKEAMLEAAKMIKHLHTLAQGATQADNRHRDEATELRSTLWKVSQALREHQPPIFRTEGEP